MAAVNAIGNERGSRRYKGNVEGTEVLLEQLL